MMWRIAHNQANWSGDSFQGSVDLLRPDLGLVQDRAAHESWQLFGIETAAPRDALRLGDHYVRGHDLVAHYSLADWDLYPQIYWRVESTAAGDCTELELLVSIQTSRLDNDPTMHVRCQFPAALCRLLCAAPRQWTLEQLASAQQVDCGAYGAICFSQPSGAPCFAQLFEGADVLQSQLQSDPQRGTITSRVSFFPGRVEKGVIRRARMRVVLGGDADVQRHAQQQIQQLRAAPPPLAT